MRLLSIMIACLLSLPSALAQKPTPGKFDTYVLAMSYQNDFCASHPKKLECQKTLDHPEMGLHGLWPNQDDDPQHTYQYCSISEQEFGKDWCNPKYDVSSKMTPEEFATLGDVMPGVQSCLYNHEWYAHGSCSGLDVKGYFQTTSILAQKFRAFPYFQGFLKANFGAKVSRSNLLQALVQDVGIKVISATYLDCRRQGNQAYFSEIHLTLNPDQLTSFPASSSFGRGNSQPDLGNCPEDGIIITSPNTTSPAATIPADAVPNPCPCSDHPGKSFCHSSAFALNADGSITSYRDGKTSIVLGDFSSVQDFINQKVCQ